MPDLATHALISFTGIRLYGVMRETKRSSAADVYMLVLGGVFPDVVEKTVPYTVNHFSYDLLPFSFSLNFLHTPLMLLMSIYVFSMLFTYSYRVRAFVLLSTGVCLHLVFDLLQGNICETGYMWFFPFSTEKPMAINLFYDDTTTPLVPLLILFAIGIEFYHRKISIDK